MTNPTIKKTQDGYEIHGAGWDFHVRHEALSSSWVVDEFDSDESEPDAAHIGTDNFHSLDEALQYILEKYQ